MKIFFQKNVHNFLSSLLYNLKGKYILKQNKNKVVDSMTNLNQLLNSENLYSKDELEAIYDTHKSFYKKAIVFKMNNGDKHLVSYSTVVASIVDSKVIVNGTYSNTTLRHIKEFLYQNGFEVGTKSFIENNYIKVGA